jgi:phosphatidate cytidylyltransferase
VALIIQHIDKLLDSGNNPLSSKVYQESFPLNDTRDCAQVSMRIKEGLFDYENAFASPFVGYVALVLAAGFIVSVLVATAIKLRRTSTPTKAPDAATWSLQVRFLVGVATAGLVFLIVLVGTGPTIFLIGILSLLTYREYARATGLFREKAFSIVIVLGIVAVTLTALDRWYVLFQGILPIFLAILATVTLLADRPKGYLQRLALGMLGLALFGSCLGHVSFLANYNGYRPFVVWLLLSSQIFYFCRSLPRQIEGTAVLFPNTCPEVTVERWVTVVFLTSLFTGALAWFAFQGTVLEEWRHVIILSLIVGIVTPLSELMVAAIRVDLGIAKPATPRVVDRLSGLILAAPPVFHYLNHYLNIGSYQNARLWMGGF